MRFKDKRAAQKETAAIAGAQQALFEMRTQYAMRVAGNWDEAWTPPDATQILSFADYLAREDMRLRVEETRLLAIMVGDKAVSYHLPKCGEEVEGPEDMAEPQVKLLSDFLRPSDGIPAVRKNGP